MLPWAQVHRVGATSVPGSVTKGDVDLNVRVPGERFREADAALAAMYARNPGSDRNADLAAFEDPHAERPLGVQLTRIGGAYDEFLGQRARLVAEPALLAGYNGLKRSFEGRPHDEYRAAKGAFWARVARGGPGG